MNWAFSAYRLLTTGGYVLCRPVAKYLDKHLGKHRPGLHERFGVYPEEKIVRFRAPEDSRPLVWMHAASVGEVRAAAPVISALRKLAPHYRLLFSTTSRHGKATAEAVLADDVQCFFAPLDFPVSVRRALAQLRPSLLVCVETELWPNWLHEAQRLGIRTAMVNGRISVRSIERYLKIKGIFRDILSHMDAFSMIGARDAERIQRLGAPPQRVFVNGNAKYDGFAVQALARDAEKMRNLLGLTGRKPVIVAGSTRPGEEEILLAVYHKIRRELADAVLILAPRHLERMGTILKCIREKGFEYQLRTQLDHGARTAQIVVMDTMGELPAVYGTASIAFCGGSLAPFGGHNLLEAAAWGKPVLYGPSMEDFVDAKELLEAEGGGLPVRDADHLVREALKLLKDEKLRNRVGDAARRAVEAQQGAAMRHARVILDVLN